MFCFNCGKNLDNNAVICPYCGVQVGTFKINNDNNASSTNYPAKRFSGFSIAGFVLSFFGWLSLLGLIFSIMGYTDTKSKALGGKGLAIAGMAISGLDLILFTIGMAIVFSHI